MVNTARIKLVLLRNNSVSLDEWRVIHSVLSPTVLRNHPACRGTLMKGVVCLPKMVKWECAGCAEHSTDGADGFSKNSKEGTVIGIAFMATKVF